MRWSITTSRWGWASDVIKQKQQQKQKQCLVSTTKENMSLGKVPIELIARGIESLGPYSAQSLILNEQHFYKNSILIDWSNKSAHPVTLRHLANFGKKITPDKLIASANFVRSELPTRLSLKIRELQNLPYQITSNYHINQVYQSYYHCFNAFRRVGKIETLEDNENFCEFVTNMLDDHLIVLPHLMMGALEVSILETMSQKDLDEFMSSMLRSRISRRVIMNQHVSMTKAFTTSHSSTDEEHQKPPDYVGEAFQYCSAHEHLKISYNMTVAFLQSLYPGMKMPELIITGEDFKFQFMTNHLDYIFTEILRNSLRSTIRKFVEVNNITDFSSMSNLAPPPVFVEVTNTKTEMTFKFSDQGGGVPLDKIDSIWSFGKNPEMARKYLDNFYKLPGLDLPERLPIVEHQYFKKRDEHRKYAPRKIAGVLDNLGKMEVASVEQGKSMLRSLASRPYAYTLGVSLPMCKVYTDYWNGTLNMCTMEGYGSDVFLKLQKLGNQEGKLQLDKA